MRVQFDLRPAGMVEKERKKTGFNLTRIIAILLMGAFFMASVGYLAIMTMQYFILQEEVLQREVSVSRLDMERAALQGRVNELRARETVFAETLRIMQDDLPTIEVLNALETNMDIFGIGLDTLRFVADVIEVTGTVATDRQVIDFSDRLRASGVFSNVFLPVTALNEQTGMISFTLRMPYFPIGQINRPEAGVITQ